MLAHTDYAQQYQTKTGIMHHRPVVHVILAADRNTSFLTMKTKRQIIPTKPIRSCGKNRYSSKIEAEQIAAEQEIIFASDNLKLSVYLCSNCGGWHLTKSREKPYI